MPVIAATTILALETGIVDRLKAKVSNVEIAPFPDPAGGYRMLHQVGALLVVYRGAKYSGLQDSGEVVQERDLWFDVHVVSRELHGHQGSYPLIEAARLALTGFRVPGFRKLVPQREGFVGHKEGKWIFALTVSAVTIASEADEEELSTLLELLTLTSEYDETEISSG